MKIAAAFWHRKCPNIFLALMTLSLASAAVRSADGQLSRPPSQAMRSEFIFDTAPFPQCHASTIAEAQDGTLMAAWFGGTKEQAPDVGIWLSRLVAGQWTAPVEVATGAQPNGNRLPCWNPVLFQPREGPLLLFYKVGPNPSRWWGMLASSSDGGQSWSAARRLPDGILGPIKNRPVQLANGDILCGSSSENGGWRVHFERTGDLGQTWSKSAPAKQEIHAIQPSILLHPAGRLQALGRTRAERLFQTWSDDGGHTWSATELTDLPNPNSGTDAVTLRDGRHLLVYNHTPKGRSPLNVALSHDGKVWEAALVLEDEPGEFSYPAVIQTRDGLVHITYTWKRRKIRHVVLDPSTLTNSPLRAGAWPSDIRR